jgi:hypothetical protein
MAETRIFSRPVDILERFRALGGYNRQTEIVASGDKTLTAAMSGRVLKFTAASGTQTATLPLATTAGAGCHYTFICGHASGEILINPNAADTVAIKGLVDHSTSVKPAAGTGVKNTAATNVLNDHLTLVCDGVSSWDEVSGAGIWASQ